MGEENCNNSNCGKDFWKSSGVKESRSDRLTVMMMEKMDRGMGGWEKCD